MLRAAGKVLKKHRALPFVGPARFFADDNLTKLRHLVPFKDAFGNGVLISFNEYGESSRGYRLELCPAKRFFVKLFSRFQMIAASGGYDAGAVLEPFSIKHRSSGIGHRNDNR